MGKKESMCPDCFRPEHRGKCVSLADRAARDAAAQAGKTAARMAAAAAQAAKDEANG
jgi:hypothetical protein